MLKFILKLLTVIFSVMIAIFLLRTRIWPAFLPLIFYYLWVRFSEKTRKKDYIDAEYKLVDQSSSTIENKEVIGAFSLKNTKFVYILFSTFLLIILGLVFVVLNTKPIKSAYEKPIEQKIIIE